MGSAKKQARGARANDGARAKAAARPTSRGAYAGSSIFANSSGVGARTFPFGLEGPGLEMHRRQRGMVALAVHGFVTFMMSGTLLALGGSGFGLLTTFSWALTTLFAVATFAEYWVLQHEVAWALFWGLPMLHGLLWLQLGLVGAFGVLPGALWHAAAAHSGGSVLMAQLGTAPLLGLPLLAVLGYVWAEQRYLLLLFHDFSAQLLPEHVWLNVAFHLFSPALPLALWEYGFNPLWPTDLPRWPGAAPVLLGCVLANGPLVYLAYRGSAEWIGSVRWLSRLSLVWCKPFRGATA